MKYAVDFRYHAREALRGKWGIAVIAGLIASLLGALGSDGPERLPGEHRCAGLNPLSFVVYSQDTLGRFLGLQLPVLLIQPLHMLMKATG